MDRETIIKLARESGLIDFRDALSSDYVQAVLDDLERFAKLVAEHEREACSRARAAKPRELRPVGTGALLGEQQLCFNKGWREGAASVRAAIRARGQ